MASNRIHQLYHDLQQERIRSAALRLELYHVRQDKDALKTQLEAAHAELAALSARNESLVRRWNSSHMAQNRRQYALKVLALSPEERSQYLLGRFEPEMKGCDEAAPACTTAAQYEALSVRRAGVDL